MEKLEVALRYCGGCNPRYDRSALALRLEREFPGLRLVPFVEPAGRYAAVLVLCGCTACCVSQWDLPAGLPRFILCSDGQYGAAAGFLWGLNKEGE